MRFRIFKKRIAKEVSKTVKSAISNAQLSIWYWHHCQRSIRLNLLLWKDLDLGPKEEPARSKPFSRITIVLEEKKKWSWINNGAKINPIGLRLELIEDDSWFAKKFWQHLIEDFKIRIT